MEEQDIKVTAKVFASVWKHWKKVFSKYWVLLGISILAGFGIVYFELILLPSQIKYIVDGLSSEDYGGLQNALYIVATCYLSAWGLNRLNDAVLSRSESRIIKNLRDYAMKGLLGKSSQFYTDHDPGGLVAKAKRFASATEYVIDEFSFRVFRTMLFIIMFSIIISTQFSFIAPYIFGWIVVFTIVTIFFFKFRLKFDLAHSRADSATTKELADILLSLFTLRIFNGVHSAYKGFKDVTSHEERARFTAWRISNIQWATMSLMVASLNIFLIATMIKRVETGQATVGTLSMILAYSSTLAMYMYELGRSINRIRTSIADSYEMSEILDLKSTEDVYDDGSEAVPYAPSISFESVEFKYPKGVQALSNVSFKFESGKRYGLVGHTGSGKSTMANLIIRMDEINEGKILVDGKELSGIDKPTIRSWISYVQQNPNFRSLTVAEIIRLGKEDATDEEVYAAAKAASCDFIWEKMPKGFDTQVGSRGVKLSGGERQRLAIAMAILKDAPIVIMDEPTSALDAETEKYIQDVIETKFKGKTMIVIAHRLSTVAVLDEILVLNDGEIVDSGHHSELIESSDMYRHMWNLQTNPQIK